MKKNVSGSRVIVNYYSENRKFHQEAFASLSEIICNDIVKGGKVVFLNDLLSKYIALLLEFVGNDVNSEDIMKYRCEKLEQKIMSIFGEEITIEMSNGPRNKKIVYKRDLDISKLACETFISEKKEKHKIQDVAYELRNSVKSISCRKLPDKITVDDVISGECDIPDKLL